MVLYIYITFVGGNPDYRLTADSIDPSNDPCTAQDRGHSYQHLAAAERNRLALHGSRECLY
jgi:hypothetical protein